MASQQHEEQEDDTSNTLGVSVYHLCGDFTNETKLYSKNVLKMEFEAETDWDGTTIHEGVKIYHIENLRNDTGFIREKGKNVISKEDGKVGASYVECLVGKDHVGTATHMLSYSWGNTITDITSALSDFCENNNLDPKRVYVWICCLCVNQHRVVAKLKNGETVPFNSFGKKFKERVLKINNLLCLMVPLDEPIYLKRLWCIYEYFMAIMNDCNLNIIMPSTEQRKLVDMVLYKEFDKLFTILGSTKIEEADASEASDKENILALVREGPGYEFVNAEVNASLRKWIFDTLAETAKKEEERSNNASTDTELSILFNNIAGVFYNNGKYDEAIEFINKSLVIYEKVYGENHKETATSYNNIGSCYDYKGDYDGALKYFLKAIAIREKVLGKDHESTATSYNNIGTCYKNKKDYDLSLEYYSKCLPIREKEFGTEHPQTAFTYNNIGGLYKEKAEYEKAMVYYDKSLTIYEEVYGENHPITASTYSLVGDLYTSKGEYTTAMEYLSRSQTIREKLLGKIHPHTAESYHHLGVLYYHMEDMDEALKHIQLALEIHEKEFGSDHSKTLETKEWHDKIVAKMK